MEKEINRFNSFFYKRREENPDEPIYITLCYILEGSGETVDMITSIFDEHMTAGDDYDAEEKDIMIDYLCNIAIDR